MPICMLKCSHIWDSYAENLVSVLLIACLLTRSRNTVVYFNASMLTHWGRMMHICVGSLIIIGSYNSFVPTNRQAIIWTNAGVFLIGLLGTNFSEILIGIQTSSSKKMHWKMSSGKWRPFCLCFNVFTCLLFVGRFFFISHSTGTK